MRSCQLCRNHRVTPSPSQTLQKAEPAQLEPPKHDPKLRTAGFLSEALLLRVSQVGGHPNDRTTWGQYDPFLWAEAFFAVGCIVALTHVSFVNV